MTTPYTLEQNGVVECKNRTLVESAKCMISFVKLPNSFRVEVMFTTNYIQNKVPTSALVGIIILKEEWIRRKPSMFHLKTIECDAYVHTPKNNRSKLDVKNKKCIQWGIVIMLR
jgi:hypothetical protein